MLFSSRWLYFIALKPSSIRDGSWRLVSLCQFVINLEIIHSFVIERGEHFGGWSRSGRIVTTRHNRDGWWRFATFSKFSIDLENIHFGVMVCKEMSADRPDRDGSCDPSHWWRMHGDGSWRLVSYYASCITYRVCVNIPLSKKKAPTNITKPPKLVITPNWMRKNSPALKKLFPFSL